MSKITNLAHVVGQAVTTTPSPATVSHLSLVLAAALFVMLALIGAWELYAIFVAGSQYTVSAQIWDWSRDYPFLPFFAGIIAGHLFFRGR